MTSTYDLGGNAYAERTIDTSHNLYGGTVTTTTDAQALNGGVALKVVEVQVQADPSNDAYLLIGPVGSQTMKLAAGEVQTIPITDASKVYVKKASGTVIANWLARGG